MEPKSSALVPSGDMGEAWFRSVAILSPTATAILEGPEHRYVFVNPAYAHLARGKGTLLGRPLAEVWPEAGREIVDILDRVRTSGMPFQAEEGRFSVERDTGPETIWLTFAFAPLRARSAEVERILVLAHEVTDQIRAQQQLREERGRRAIVEAPGVPPAQVLEHISDAVVVIDGEGRVTYWGPGASALYGLPAAEVLGRPLTECYRYEWLDPEDEARAHSALERVGRWRGRNVHVLLSGERRPVESTVSVLYDGAGRQAGLLAVIRDTTDRIRAEQARLEAQEAEESLRLAHERLTATLEASPVVVFTQDEALRYTWVHNPVLGLAAERVLGKTDEEVLERAEDARPITELKRRVLATGRPARAEVRVHRGDEAHWYDLSVRPQLEDGRTCGIFATATDITKLKRAEEDLARADRKKDDFLAVLSHELRNPLAPIRSSLAVLDRVPPGSEPDRRARAVLYRQTEQLARLVDDLLDVTRISRGKLALARARVDLVRIVRRTADDHRLVFEQLGLRLTVDAPFSPIWIDADAARIGQLIGNLLSNAMKFTPSAGRVDVTLTSDDALARLEVGDTGAGIDPDDLPFLFEPFYQTDHGRRPRGGGLGIGLALVRELAIRHQGSVRAESDGIGRGARFVVELPVVPAPPPEVDATKPRVERGSGLSVLIVDDNEDAAQTLADLLVLDGHTTHVVYSGRAAIDELRRARYGALICDIGLPDISGYEVMEALAGAPHARPGIAVALTGYTQPKDRERARAAGFDAHLSKPAPLEELRRLLARAGQPAPPPSIP